MTTEPNAATTPTAGTSGQGEGANGGTTPLQLLLAPSAVPELAHAFALTITVALCWGRMPLVLLIGWTAAVLGATITRGLVRRYARTQGVPAAQALRMVRLTVGAHAAAWGLGAAAAGPDLEFRSLALLLVLFAGLVAGALTTLTADLVAGRLFVIGLLAPLAAGVLLNGTDREHWLGLLMLAVFAGFILALMTQAHRQLLEFDRAQVRSRASAAEAVRERTHVDALLRSAPLAIVTVDRTGRIGRVNPAFEQLFGYGAAEAAGRDLDSLIVPTSEVAKAQGLTRRVRRGETVTTEVERRHRAGHIVPVRVSSALVGSGADADLVVVYENIAERRRAQDAIRRLAAIVESSNDAIVGQALDGTITAWNSAAQRLFGYPIAAILGQPISKLVPPDHAGEIEQIVTRLARGEKVAHFETESVHQNGSRIAVSLAVSVVRDANGRMTGYSVIARDATEEVAARRAQSEARDAAERSARARSAFLANMSHEIRTPMNAILGLSELMLDTELSAEQRHALDTIRTAADGLLTLLNDVLDFSKIEAEHLELESVPFDLHQLVSSTVSLLAVRAGVKHLELLADVQADVATTVRGDPTRLRQVLTNLIGNAIKFTEKGEVVVTVARDGANDGANDGSLRFGVRDTGIGIAPDKLDTIFEEFTQADASTTRHHGGTGLGLAIARRMVRLMGGELSVQSELGKGSEFWFVVQLTDASERAVAPLPPGGLALVGKRALVVDDNETNRRIVRDVLTGAGMTVDETVNAADALAALSRARSDGAPYAIAILDVQMPDRDRFALAGDVRADPAFAGTKLLIFTSAGQRGDGQRCRELGIEGYLSKPASRTELIEAVSAVLGDLPGPDRLVTRHAVAEARRHLRILLAEDNPVNQEVAVAMLRKRGHQVDVAGNGREAVAAVARDRYDVVLMDVMMPEMDGYQATAAIRATDAGRTLPIVACTAHALSGERERCLAAGMSGYLAKPFKAHDLFAAVEGWGGPDGPAEPAAGPAPPSPVDFDSFRRAMREAGAEEAVDAILDTFVTTAPDRLTDLERAVTSADAESIRRAAHAYKSAAATIGAASLAGQLGEMEAAARAGAVDGAAAAIKRIGVAHAAVLAAIASDRATHA